jgi:hypothetical protein
VLKFYCKAHKRSDRKYNIIVNRGDLGNIFITCTKVIPLLLQTYPSASFGLAGARSIDSKGRVEDFKNNQRFRIYSQLISTKIGPITFEHFEYPHVSAYLLVNKKHPDILEKERELAEILIQTYQDLTDA